MIRKLILTCNLSPGDVVMMTAAVRDLHLAYPANAATGKLYRGVNPLLLELAAMDKGYSSKHWATYRQWLALGLQVQRGQHGTKIMFWQPITSTKTNGEPPVYRPVKEVVKNQRAITFDRVNPSMPKLFFPIMYRV